MDSHNRPIEKDKEILFNLYYPPQAGLQEGTCWDVLGLTLWKFMKLYIIDKASVCNVH